MNSSTILVGLLVVRGIALALKRMIPQTRPNGRNHRGMPSWRAASVSYFICCVALPRDFVVAAVVFLALVFEKYARKEHSLLQIAAGAALGACMAAVIRSIGGSTIANHI